MATPAPQADVRVVAGLGVPAEGAIQDDGGRKAARDDMARALAQEFASNGSLGDGDDGKGAVADSGSAPPPARAKKPATAPAPSQPAAAAEAEDDEAGEDETEAPDEPDEEESDADEESEDDAPAVEDADEEPDPQELRRAQKAQREERRIKALHAQNLAEQERQQRVFEARLAPRLQQLEQFEAAAARARYDLPSVLLALGIQEDAFAAHAQALYARSPQGRKDPRYAQTADRQLQDMELRDRAERAEQLAQQALQRQEAIENAARAERWLSGVLSKVNGETPLVTRWMAKDPDGVRERLIAEAERYCAAHNEIPDPAELLELMEASRRADLERLDIDVEAVLKAPPANKQKPKQKPIPTAEKKPVPTLNNDLRRTRPPKAPAAPQSRDALADSIVDDIRAGRISDG